MKTVLPVPRRVLVAALCCAALALASIAPARAAEAPRDSPARPPEPIQRHYDDVNYIARHASVEQQMEVRLAVLRAPGSKPPPHLREISDRIARVEAAIAEVEPGILGRSPPPPLVYYLPTEVIGVTGTAPLLRVRVRVAEWRGQTREEVHVWEQNPRGWMRREGAFFLLKR
jgi:hypothetical protein